MTGPEVLVSTSGMRAREIDSVVGHVGVRDGDAL